MDVSYSRSAAFNSSSIMNQKKICSDFMTSKGLECNKHYIDNGFSGLSKVRPGLYDLLTDINKINTIVISEPAILSRDLDFLIHICKICKSKNVKIFDASSGEDITDIFS